MPWCYPFLDLLNPASSSGTGIEQKSSEKLSESDVGLVTTVRKNMKAKVISAFDNIMLSKRYFIETRNEQLKIFHKYDKPTS
jgi:hypothetical protein